MATFRFNMGSYKDSIETCFMIKNKAELYFKLTNFNSLTRKEASPDDFICSSPRIDSIDSIKIIPYIFDERNGWNTHLVVVNNKCVKQDPYVIGFLSDELEEKF